MGISVKRNYYQLCIVGGAGCWSSTVGSRPSTSMVRNGFWSSCILTRRGNVDRRKDVLHIILLLFPGYLGQVDGGRVRIYSLPFQKGLTVTAV